MEMGQQKLPHLWRSVGKIIHYIERFGLILPPVLEYSCFDGISLIHEPVESGWDLVVFSDDSCGVQASNINSEEGVC